jgi:hypothetical protein
MSEGSDPAGAAAVDADRGEQFAHQSKGADLFVIAFRP